MNNYFELAVEEAEKCLKSGDVPVGAIITLDNKIIAKGHNKKEMKNKAINHAEIIAIEKASKKLKTWNLGDCVMYVTLEPCDMCKELISNCHIRDVYFLAKKSEQSNKFETKFIQTNDCEQIKTKYIKKLKSFFALLRK